MRMQIVSGKFSGRVLKTPKGLITHPMSGRVRGSLFNILGDELKDASVLDAFSGTGSLGLEALSRGAKKATFVDRDRSAVEALKSNIQMLDVESSTSVFNCEIKQFLKQIEKEYYDIILIDPPYDNLQLSTVFEIFGLLKHKGIVVLSYPGRGEVPVTDEFVVVDNRSYGNAALAFYRRK